MQEDQQIAPLDSSNQRVRQRTYGSMPNAQPIASRDEPDFSTRLTYLAIGGAVGALVALLLAPKSGYELRGDIADVTRKGALRTRDTAQQIGSKAGEYYEVTRERANELADVAREAAARKGEQLSAAIEAGKQAYSEEKRRMHGSDLLEFDSVYDEGQKRLS